MNTSELHIWHITLRPFGLTESERKPWTLSIAMRNNFGDERMAVDFAKANIHSREWWEGVGIADVKHGGRLFAVEGEVGL